MSSWKKSIVRVAWVALFGWISGCPSNPGNTTTDSSIDEDTNQPAQDGQNENTDAPGDAEPNDNSSSDVADANDDESDHGNDNESADDNDNDNVNDSGSDVDDGPEQVAVAAGAVLFDENGCGGCHAADGSGGIGPDIRLAGVETLDARLRDETSDHAGGLFPELTDGELSDLAAFLGEDASAPPEEDTPVETFPEHVVDLGNSGILHADGFSDPLTNCVACHGGDLFGSASTPACWSCHGSIWDGPPDFPPTHTRTKDGFHHGPGLERPFGDCDGCHGVDLTGTTLIPSCFSCHGKKWNDGNQSDDGNQSEEDGQDSEDDEDDSDDDDDGED